MRKYESIWVQLKRDYVISVSANPSAHNRIIQAVKKEKANDIGFRYLKAESGKKCSLKHISAGKLIKFYLVDLVLPITINDL